MYPIMKLHNLTKSSIKYLVNQSKFHNIPYFRYIILKSPVNKSNQDCHPFITPIN